MSVKLRKRKLPSGRIQLYLDIHHLGKRWTESLGLLLHQEPAEGRALPVPLRHENRETWKKAEYLKIKRLEGIDRGLFPESGTKTRKESFTRYCEALAESHPTLNTRKSWIQAIDHLKTFGREEIVFGALDRRYFERFREYLLRTAGLAPNSAQMYLARIKTALHRAVEDGKLTADPSAAVRIQKEDSLRVHLDFEEIQRLSDAPCPNDQVRAAFLFSCFSGLRYGDVEALTWDNVKLGAASYIEFRQKKTRQAERLPLSAEATRILGEQRTARASENLRRSFPAGTVFFMPTQPVVDKQLKQWAKAAGIDKPISFHKARHTFATLTLSSGVDIYATSRLLGHKNIQTTQIYAKVIDERKRQAVGMLPTLTPRSNPIRQPRAKFTHKRSESGSDSDT